MAKASRECCRRKAFGNSLFYQYFPQAWPFLDRKNFTVRCCSRPWGLRGCDLFVVSFLISILRLVHSDSAHISVSYTLCARIHIVKERCLAWFFVVGHEVGEKEVRKVECLLLCLGRRAVLEDAVHDQPCFDFLTMFESLQEGHKYALGQSERSSLTSHLIFFRQTPLPICCRENAHVQLCSWAKKTVTFYFHISVEHCDGSQGQKSYPARQHAARRKRKTALVLTQTVK